MNSYNLGAWGNKWFENKPILQSFQIAMPVFDSNFKTLAVHIFE